jgi:NifU-like protein involved in Fe-S cluster formation
VSTPLYTPEILRLATDAAMAERLAAPDASVEARTPVCGSRITLDLALDDDLSIARVGFDAHACAMGQAAAGLLARGVAGCSVGRLDVVTAALAAWLAGESETAPDWPGIAALAPARAYPARHAAILLPFRAATDAGRAALTRRMAQA